MENILEVKKLKISFRTINGTVKAVRNISFDLKKGETLAIVGESGSGKSVTSKAILGILAGNSIIDGGEILYDGKDLLRISEDDMHKIRGDKIAMIFQDPLSSLDPIVKIGKQITEAMLLKNKASRKISRNEFNTLLDILRKNIIETIDQNNKEEIEKINNMTKLFDTFNIQSLKLENSYNNSESHTEDLLSVIDDVIFKAERNQKLAINGLLKEFKTKLEHIDDEFFTHNYKEQIKQQVNNLDELIKTNKTSSDNKEDKNADVDVNQNVVEELKKLHNLLDEMIKQEKPNFFRIGYYALCNPNEDLYSTPVNELNEKCLKYLNENFMLEFLEYVKVGLKNSYEKSVAGKQKVLPLLEDLKKTLQTKEFTHNEIKEKSKVLKLAIDESIDYCATVKDSIAYTFITTLDLNINSYFNNMVTNEKEKARFEKQTARRQKLIDSGKTIDWEVVPMKYVDLDDQIEDIIALVERLENKYKAELEVTDIDYDKKAVSLIDFFKEKASYVVYKVTKHMAKEKAIKLMEEVGIPDARIRYYQYPFEFSGGMRQRIVIAIALAADPDILICDEPTTALDVTIQSQILELINKLKVERNLSVIFITHDLGVVANMADKIAVMYAGKIVEYGTDKDVFYSPAHPYTWALLSSMPDLDTKEKLEAIPGTPPNMIYPPKGDAFAARNKYALKIDFEEEPPMFKISDTHYAATWLLHPDAPKVEIPKIITDRIERMKQKGGAVDGK